MNSATKDITGLSALAPDRRAAIASLPRSFAGIRALLPQGTTTAGAVSYARELTFTNGANVVAEGAAKPESDKTFEAVTAPVATIAHHFKLGRQSYEDVPGLASQIEANGTHGVALAEDGYLLDELLAVAPDAPAPAAGANLADAVGMAVFDLAVKGYVADGVVLNPADWGEAAMLKDSAGNYLFPSWDGEAGLWGLRLVLSSRMPAGQFLAGQFRGNSLLLDRDPVNVRTADQHADDLVRNMVAVLAEERIALLIQRAEAFEKGVRPVTASVAYFVDPAGSDTNDGLSVAAPFRTLAKISALTLRPGDTVSLRRGGVWRETLNITASGAAGAPVTFDAFGAGAKPVISGADVVTAWTTESATNFTADAAMQGYWYMEEAAAAQRNDGSAKVNHLTQVNNVGQSATRKQGSFSAQFVRASSMRLRRTNATLSAAFPGKVSTPDLTCGCWVQLASTGATMFAISKGERYVIYYNANGRFHAELLDGGAYTSAFSDATYTATGVWHHVVLRSKGSTNKELALFVNGIRQTPKTAVQAAVPTSTDDFCIGAFSGASSFWDGLIDEAFILNRALTDAEISSIHQSGLSGGIPLYYAALTTEPLKVWRDNAALTRAQTKAQLGAGKFWYDDAADRLYVFDNPAGHTMEVSQRDYAIRMDGQSYVSLTGLATEKYQLYGVYSTGTKPGRTLTNVDGSWNWQTGFDYPVGVNMSEAETSWGSFPSAPDIDFVKQSGFRTARLPFAWERMQPVLNGPLDATYSAAMKSFIAAAGAAGLKVIADCHNYGRYNSTWHAQVAGGENITPGTGDILGSAALPYTAFADLWTKVATLLKDTVGLGGYGLMNEPHDMGGASVWPSAAQAAVNAIRAVDTATPVLVAGDGWSSAMNWRLVNETLAITDPSNKIVYEAHQYFDANADADYAGTYEQEGGYPNVGLDRVQPFIDWCAAGGRKGFLGEFGVPRTDARWFTAMDRFLTRIQDSGVAGTYWLYMYKSPADPSWWPNYDVAVLGLMIGTPNQQLPLLNAHNAPLV